jgi:hypothetical protein
MPNLAYQSIGQQVPCYALSTKMSASQIVFDKKMQNINKIDAKQMRSIVITKC